jgi:hypothetical protein
MMFARFGNSLDCLLLLPNVRQALTIDTKGLLPDLFYYSLMQKLTQNYGELKRKLRSLGMSKPPSPTRALYRRLSDPAVLCIKCRVYSFSMLFPQHPEHQE